MRFNTRAIITTFVIMNAGLAAAQETTATITGRTVDAQGLPVPGVAVTETGPQGSKTAITDSQGPFTFPFVTPGIYTVRSERR